MTDRKERFREDDADIPRPDRENLTDNSPSEDELAEGGFHALDVNEVNQDEIVEVEDDGLEGRPEVDDETVDADLLLGGLADRSESDFQAAGSEGETGNTTEASKSPKGNTRADKGKRK